MPKNIREADRKRNSKETKKKEDWEVLFKWKIGTRPFVLQKLGYKCLPGIVNAYKSAKEIRKLLISVGNLTLKDVKILGVARHGAFEDFIAEHRFVLRKRKEDIKKLIADAKTINAKAKKKATKTNSIKSGSFKTTV